MIQNINIATQNSERSDECIGFTMIITSRNNAPISNYGGAFRCKSEYPWCIIQTDKSSPFRIFRNINLKINEKCDLCFKFLGLAIFNFNKNLKLIDIVKFLLFTSIIHQGYSLCHWKPPPKLKLKHYFENLCCTQPQKQTHIIRRKQLIDITEKIKGVKFFEINYNVNCKNVQQFLKYCPFQY
ncbi:hypothetical protein AGLY_011671 [Aphis glycines]|uniref:Uncharacterized protein n=1 Tax=Aphis glycines TaxID=307491 RepID=A0A6G0TB96_APHGL|nr:hypothetical protein AGLY_011671 [Aphis glycines]